MSAMAILVRRSNLLVPADDAAAVKDAWRHDADAITLDLEALPLQGKPEGRARVKEALATVARGGAEVFVRVDKTYLHADLDAAVWPGLDGIVLSRIDSVDEVREAEEAVLALERSRGLATGSLTFIVLLESARAVWDMRAIVRASPRISQAGLDEPDLARSLGFAPVPDLDPFVYARGRLAVECTAAKVGAIGMTYPFSVFATETSAQEIETLAAKAKNLGMKGVLCPHASWVGPVNKAFTPSAELVAYNKRVREAFAAGVAAGTAAVPLDGRMIDVPVDEWAIVVLATAEACAKRDAEKRAALARAGARA
jgi:citrate lyase subunit beta/citryl-CoA lyase